MTRSLRPLSIRRLFLQVTAVALLMSPASVRGYCPPAAPVHFEVVSIRRSKAEGIFTSSNITPDGYRVHGQSMLATIALAYYPLSNKYWQGDPFKQTPAGMDQKYDIDAKVPEKDLAVWQSQGPDVPLLRSALREMLEDRCKLRLHMEAGHKVSVLELIVLKNGPKGIKPYDLSEAIPSGALHFSNYPARLVPGQPPTKFFNTSMAALAYFLS